MIVGVLTTCHTPISNVMCICFFLFNRTTLQVFVTYLTGALYVHPLWFYKHQHDNRVRSKLLVACQRWWFQWRFWFVPSVPGYLREEEECKHDLWRNPIERNHMGMHLENEVAVVKTPTIISNNPLFYLFGVPQNTFRQLSELQQLVSNAVLPQYYWSRIPPSNLRCPPGQPDILFDPTLFWCCNSNTKRMLPSCAVLVRRETLRKGVVACLSHLTVTTDFT